MQLKRCMRFPRGQGLTEYALILALVALIVIIAVSLLGKSVSNTYCTIAANFGSQSDACAGASTSYCEANFNNLNDWEFNRKGANYWQSIDGRMCMTHDSYRDYAYSTCSQSMPAGDYIIHLNGAELTQGPGYGIFFRLQQNGESPTGYAFQYDPGASGFVFRRWQNGVEVKTLAYKNASGYDFYNTSHDIEIHVKGDQFSAYIDGVLTLTATDSNYTSGGSGFRTWSNTRTCFEDLSIDQITE